MTGINSLQQYVVSKLSSIYYLSLVSFGIRGLAYFGLDTKCRCILLSWVPDGFCATLVI